MNWSRIFLVAAVAFFALRAFTADVPHVDEVWAGVACLVASKVR